MKLNLLISIITLLIFCNFIVSGAGPGRPVGVAGRITIDDIHPDGVTLTLRNLDDGEVKNPVTMNGGYYACGFGANDGDTIQLEFTYEGVTYVNVIIVDYEDHTQWLNLTIDTDNPPPPPPPPPTPPSNNNDDDDEEEEDEETSDENETEDEIENIYYNLTVNVYDNITGNPLSNVSVIIYNITMETIVAENNTDEEGNATFYLEEGEYIVEANETDYSTSRKQVTLSGSMGCILSLEESMIQNDETDYTPTQDVQEQGFSLNTPVILGFIIIIGIISIIFVIKWKYFK